MPDHSFLGLSTNDITAISAVASVITAVVALLLTIVNIRVLNRSNIVGSVQWVNEKFTELNNLDLSNNEILKLNFLNKLHGSSTAIEIEEAKRDSITHNYLNILEGIYIQMTYRALKKVHAKRIFDNFVPLILENENSRTCLEKGGYNLNFIKYCFENYPVKQKAEQPEVNILTSSNKNEIDTKTSSTVSERTN